MNALEQARLNIDEIDREMARLFEKRMDAVTQVLRYKQANGIPILDSNRETAVIQKNIGYIHNPDYIPLYKEFLQHNMALSRQFQAHLLNINRVAYPGGEGSYAHLALKRLFPKAVTVPCSSWAEVFDAVENGEAGAGIVPFEDTHDGDISAILDLCFTHQLFIHSVYEFPITLSLLALPGANLWQIREVYGHPHAIRQSETFLRTMDLPSHPLPSTVQAAQFVAQSKDPTLAAIASPDTGAAFGLTELAKGIRTEGKNVARFLILSRQHATEGNHFSLLFTIDNRPGKLADVIQEIGHWGFNMETIQSQPRPDMPFSYYFYVELAGTLQQAEALITALHKVCQTVRLLGVYQR